MKVLFVLAYRAVGVGRGASESLRGDGIPELKKVEPWDGKDGQVIYILK